MPFHGKDFWALILGGSSGFGLASAKKLADWGMNIFLVHRDTRGAMLKVKEHFDALSKTDVAFHALNLDALTESGRTEVLTQLESTIGNGRVRVLLHSIAAGRLKRFAPSQSATTGDAPQSLATEEDLAATVQAMGFNLLSWVQDVCERGLFADDARVMAFTSEGSVRVWPGYGPVSAAKATLEAVVRSIAAEFAPFGIRCNLLQPGVTDTPALRFIPSAKDMMSRARGRNPFERLTRPEDVANVVALLCMDEAAWINGATLRADGGEFVVV